MFEIVVGSDFQFDKIGDIYTCTFYCHNDEISFPDDEWTDFALHVLDGWLNELPMISTQKEANFRLWFEDGPFWIECTKCEQQLMLKFMTPKPVSCIPVIEIEYEVFRDKIMAALRKLRTNLYLAGYVDHATEVGQVIKKYEKNTN